MLSEKQKGGNWGFESFVRMRGWSGRVEEEYSFTFRELIPLKNIKVEVLPEDKGGFQILYESIQPMVYLFFPVVDYQKTNNKDITQTWVTRLTKTINELQEATQSFKRSSSVKTVESDDMSSASKDQLIRVPRSKLQQIRINSGKIFGDLNKLWVQSDKAIQPRQLLPISDQIEQLTNLIDQLKKEQPWAISQDDYSSLSNAVAEGKQAIGQLKDFVLENFPTNKKESAYPRQLTAAVMKWYLKLTSVWTSFEEKYIKTTQ